MYSSVKIGGPGFLPQYWQNGAQQNVFWTANAAHWNVAIAPRQPDDETARASSVFAGQNWMTVVFFHPRYTLKIIFTARRSVADVDQFRKGISN